MIKTMINAWKVPDIRKKLLFTAFIILVFRIGSVIPVPFLNIVDEINVGKGNTILTYLSLMTGSAFTYGTIFAMSITPYINSSIITREITEGRRRRQKEACFYYSFRNSCTRCSSVYRLLLLSSYKQLPYD